MKDGGGHAVKQLSIEFGATHILDYLSIAPIEFSHENFTAVTNLLYYKYKY